jgi:integrase
MSPELIALQTHSNPAQFGPEALLADLPTGWHGDVIGSGIDTWDERVTTGRANQLRLVDLPPGVRAELAWMAYWQFRDGCKVSVSALNAAAGFFRWLRETGRLPTESVLSIDPDTFTRDYRICFESRRGRLPSKIFMTELHRVLYGYPRHALEARVSSQQWWALDEWIPRCDPRIPLRDREPLRSERARPGRAQILWVRSAMKWHLGTALEAGHLTWSSVVNRSAELLVFDRWLASFPDCTSVWADGTSIASRAADFRRWASRPESRASTPDRQLEKVTPHAVNRSLRAVLALMTFISNHAEECAIVLGSTPWDQLTEAHPTVWRRQITRQQTGPSLNDDHYVDDHALAQIVSSLPVLGASSTETVTVSIDGHERELAGLEHPDAMRILLLQILTGRRASEICMCDFDCLTPPTSGVASAADGDQVARFRYAQSKIDQAPDTILVDAEVVAVINEQRAAVQSRYPSITAHRYLFPQMNANDHGDKPVSRGNYARVIRNFSNLVAIKDSTGRAVKLIRTHRFRHTRLTRLAELGLPVHVLQRYAGHANPTMSMHYVAQREEHAEQAFLATRKFKADGTAVMLSREDHDGMHLFDRADRLLPHGYCLLPPLQTCNKGNACLTFSVFVTDTSYLDNIQRQLDETTALIERTSKQFLTRHGKPMPDDNVWLTQRTAERDALVKLIETMRRNPTRSCQGAGSPTSGPIPITIDTASHRNRDS